MNGNAGYALQKLELSVIGLAVGEGDVRSRLYDVYIEHLHAVRKHDFPQELSDEWIKIYDALTEKGPKVDEDGNLYVGSLKNTLLRIRNKKGAKIANDIVLLSQRLRGYFNDAVNNTL